MDVLTTDHSPQDVTLSIVVPAYCEGNHLRESVGTIRSVVDGLNHSYEIILVDDGSWDNTWEVIEALKIGFPQLQAIRFTRNFGKEAAIAAGLQHAHGQAVIVMDADLQHPPALIPEMVRIWAAGEADIVDAVKSDRGSESLPRRLGAMLFYASLDWLSGYNLSHTSDFKLLDRRVIAAWREFDEREMFFRGMTAWLGFRHAKISFVVPARSCGGTRWAKLRLMAYAINAVVSFSSKPLHLITLLGVSFFIGATLLGLQTFYRYFTGSAVSGFATVILLLLIIGSLLMISMGIIGIYIARIYDEVKGRPRYVVGQVIG